MLYIYDGSFDGVMTAVFEIFDFKDKSAMIQPETQSENMSFYERHRVITDFRRSFRVQAGLEKLGKGVPERMYTAWLSHSEGIEDLMLAAIRLGFKYRVNPFTLLQDERVHALDGIAKKVGSEAHRMLQFVRFVKLGDELYAADIKPEYDVLPMIGNHFHKRFPQSRFMIRDLTHLRAIISSPHGWEITSIQSAQPPLPQNGEYERMWKKYFEIIAIEQRRNLKLQQQFVPKKYRSFLTEFLGEDLPTKRKG